MSWRACWAASIASLWLVVSVPAARAQSEAGSAAQSDPVESHLDSAARELFFAGRAAFEAGRYTDALVSFERAYELSDRPELLFNIAHTLDRLRRDDDAIRAFESYLATTPPDGQRAQVEARLEILREQRAAASQSDSETAHDDTSHPHIVDGSAAAEAPTPNEAPRRRSRILGVLAAVVVVGVVTGLALGLRDRTPDRRPGDSGDVHLALVRW